MKNLIISLLVMLIAISCKKEVAQPVLITEGKMSIVNLNTTQTVIYKDLYAYPTNMGGTPEMTGIHINGVKDDNFSIAISFIRKKDQPFEYYQAGGVGYSVLTLGSYGVNTFSKTESLLFSIPSNDINRGRERLLITKDDKDSLAGSFEIRLIDKKIPVPDTVRMKGSFSIAKKGRF